MVRIEISLLYLPTPGPTGAISAPDVAPVHGQQAAVAVKAPDDAAGVTKIVRAGCDDPNIPVPGKKSDARVVLLVSVG